MQYDELGDRVAFLIEHKEQLSTQLRELEQHCENQQQRINDMIQPRWGRGARAARCGEWGRAGCWREGGGGRAPYVSGRERKRVPVQ